MRKLSHEYWCICIQKQSMEFSTNLYCFLVSYLPAFVSRILVANTRTMFTNKITLSWNRRRDVGQLILHRMKKNKKSDHLHFSWLGFVIFQESVLILMVHLLVKIQSWKDDQTTLWKWNVIYECKYYRVRLWMQAECCGWGVQTSGGSSEYSRCAFIIQWLSTASCGYKVVLQERTSGAFFRVTRKSVPRLNNCLDQYRVKEVCFHFIFVCFNLKPAYSCTVWLQQDGVAEHLLLSVVW